MHLRCSWCSLKKQIPETPKRDRGNTASSAHQFFFSRSIQHVAQQTQHSSSCVLNNTSQVSRLWGRGTGLSG